MGVKELWPLLQPAGRKVNIEALRGKRLAVDILYRVVIWLHQFLKAMRDEEGKPLANAHLLGFFRRICKLLHNGIKPVFVFDGAMPTLKRRTVARRRQRRMHAESSVQRTAKRLLAMQMRTHALNAVSSRCVPVS
ncbi:XPG N-terminal domain-containing protein [Thamnocephalis sphaerospora]|uniref:XPG N-terminal domain-containing protein n=1 Tax=Thamnocephalis sphaerospora TaxID=78915 RepID=A0A4P9XJ27_9FUNG|nr:XPG N-terminal domain-containing protein [Thamnocephalis sphaerospora]|eukprot:RKP05728.1 XPG N-terminal domain-containing protein [Thamnocephalis sphaerospora]